MSIKFINLYKYVFEHNYSLYGQLFADWHVFDTRESAELGKESTNSREYIGTFQIEVNE